MQKIPTNIPKKYNFLTELSAFVLYDLYHNQAFSKIMTIQGNKVIKNRSIYTKIKFPITVV